MAARVSNSNWRMMKVLYPAVMFAAITSCVDPIAFNVPNVEFQLVVDGSITNKPGPYSVYLMRANAINRDLDTRVGIARATLTIKSDAGEQEQLTEVGKGLYQTNLIQGVVGRSYWINIRLESGVEYESERERLNLPGDLNSIAAEFQEDNMLSNGIEVQADKFNLLVNATGSSPRGNYYRWRTTGTYAIHTYPELMTALTLDFVRYPAPAPCSGYVVNSSWELVQQGPCTCCDCWVTVADRLSHVSDDALIQNGEFREVNIGEVPINQRTFYEKYHVYVEQVSLNRKAYEFFRLIAAQKEGAASLFQPASGKLPGNIHRVHGDEKVLGFFWAGGISVNTTFIDKREVPYRVAPIDTVKMECYNVLNAVAIKPPFWQ